MDTAVKITPERFAEGLTIQEFVAGMQQNREAFGQNYQNFLVRQEDVEQFGKEGRVLKVLALVEEWCGDVIRYLPPLVRLAEAMPNWEVRVFYRDQYPDMAGLWLKRGQFRAIPVFVFMDEQLNELAYFIEKPDDVYSVEKDVREAFAAQHPDLPDARLPSSEMSAETLDLYAPFIREFRANNVSRWQQLFIDQVRSQILGWLEAS